MQIWAEWNEKVTSITPPFQTKLGSKQHEKVLQMNASSDWTAANALECRCQYSPLWSGHANQWLHESLMHMHMELTLQGYNHCEHLQIIVWTPSVLSETCLNVVGNKGLGIMHCTLVCLSFKVPKAYPHNWKKTHPSNWSYTCLKNGSKVHQKQTNTTNPVWGCSLNYQCAQL